MKRIFLDILYVDFPRTLVLGSASPQDPFTSSLSGVIIATGDSSVMPQPKMTRQREKEHLIHFK